MMSEDIHKWSDGRYTLMFDEHTFFVFDNEKEERMTALKTTKRLNEQQATIEEQNKLIEKLRWDLNKTREDLNYFANLKVMAMKGCEPNE